MKALFAFIRKEITEQIRSGRLWLLLAVFVFFGIMNPAVAKLTPWLLELLADSLAESGMTVTDVTVSAMDSWVQFFKNAPICLIVFAVVQSGVFTREYASGTLVLSLTKGLARYKVVVAKAAVLFALWTACYFMGFAITYGYNAYFWDNSVAQSLAASVFFWWVFGVWVIALSVLFSTLFQTNTQVLVATGGSAFACYLLGLLPKVKRVVPTLLTDGNALIYGTSDAQAYTVALIVAAVTAVACMFLSLLAFNKKQL